VDSGCEIASARDIEVPLALPTHESAPNCVGVRPGRAYIWRLAKGVMDYFSMGM
jgi:hypothetical protein